MLENKTVPTIPVFLFNKAQVDRSVKNTPTYKLQHKAQARQRRNTLSKAPLWSRGMDEYGYRKEKDLGVFLI